MPYKAFISYSHAADGLLAPTLQSALHRFAKPFYRLRAIRVFRDKTSLRLTPELWPLIQSALGESEYFLLLASPEAAESPWVESEVDEWLRLKHGSLDKFLIVLTAGEIAWESAANDFDWAATSALPTNLRGKFKQEPLYSDLRWAKKATDLSLRNPQFLEEIGAIGATLHGKAKDELVGQDVRQHRVFKLVSGVVALLLLALAVGASAAAYYANGQRKVAVKQTLEAQRQSRIAIEAADRERAAAQKEREARDREEQQRIKAEQAADKEKLARENETKQRRKAEQATENEKVARLQAEERRKEAERQSKIAFSRELASNANSQLNVNTELSALLAIEAVKVSRTAQSEEALRQAAFESRLKAVMKVYDGSIAVSDLPYGNHESYVSDAVFSPDGRYVVTASYDAKPRVWEAQTGRVVATMEGNEDAISHAEFSPDARLVLTIGNSGARLWETQTGKLVRAMQHVEQYRGANSEKVAYATFSPDGRYIVTAGNDHTARIWETATGKNIAVMQGHSGAVKHAVFSPDGRYVATASDDKTARVWEALTGKEVATLSGDQDHACDQRNNVLSCGHRDRVLSVAFSPDGKLVVTASLDKTARVWEVDTAKPIAILGGQAGAVRTAIFSPKGDFILTASDDGTARVWETGTNKVIAELRGHTASLSKAAFSPDGKYIVTAGTDGTARVWEASFPVKGEEEEAVENDPTLAVPAQVRWRSLGVLRGHSGALLSATFSPDGEYIATASVDGTARVWEASFPQNLEQLHGDATQVVKAAFSPDGKYLATADHDDHIRVWEVHTGRNVALLHEDDEADWSVEFSPGGKFLVTAAEGNFVWQTGTWRNVFKRDGLRKDIGGFSWDDHYALVAGNVFETNTWQKVFDLSEKESRFLPGGKLISSTLDGGKTLVREVGTWRIVTELPVVPASFSPDGELFLTRPNEEQPTEQVWETRTGRELAVLPEGGNWWSPDSRFVVSMEDDRRVRVWDVRTGRGVAELTEYGDVKQSGRSKLRVNSIAFSPDSKLLLTANNDMTARLWEVGTGKEVMALRGHQKEVMSAAFSPDGKLVVTVSDDRTMRVWDTATGVSLAEYRGQDPREASVFSPDGRLILTNPEALEAQVFACDLCYSLEDLLAITRSHVTRDLTSEEREKYLHETHVK